jgi:hypothetical protein
MLLVGASLGAATREVYDEHKTSVQFLEKRAKAEYEVERFRQNLKNDHGDQSK